MVALLLMVTVAAAPIGLPGEAFAQSGADCPRWEWVIIGYDESGEPVYGFRLRDRCGTGGGGSSGSRPHTCHHPRLGEVDCRDPVRGLWSPYWNCYVKPMEPQPPAGDGRWEGRGPDEGAVYVFSCPIDEHSEQQYYQFLTQPPGVPSIVALGQEAVRRLPLAEPVIGIAPSPDGAGLVGVPVWLWVDNADTGWGPVGPRCVSGPGITVCARAEVVGVRWQVGTGETVACDGPGTPYRADLAAAEPACGYTYAWPSSTRPDGRYQVTAETEWQVQWWVAPRGSGAEVEDFTFRDSSTSIQINELQVVTSGGRLGSGAGGDQHQLASGQVQKHICPPVFPGEGRIECLAGSERPGR